MKWVRVFFIFGLAIVLLLIYMWWCTSRPMLAQLDLVGVVYKHNIVVGIKYRWHQRWLWPLQESRGLGASRPYKMLVNSLGEFTLPVLPASEDPGVWYEKSTVIEAYVPPIIPVVNDGVYVSYVQKGPAFFLYRKPLPVFEFEKKIVDPRSKDQLLLRLTWLGSLLDHAEESFFEAYGDEYHFSGVGEFASAMYDELVHICKFWIPEYYPIYRVKNRDHLPVTCINVLGVVYKKDIPM